MIDFDDAARQLTGAWRLIAGDEEWSDGMDLTVDGVFKSLWALALAAPLATLSILAENSFARATPNYAQTIFAKAPMALILPISLIVSGIIWIGTVAALAYAAKRLGAERSVAGLVVSYNWSQLLVYFASAAPAAVFLLTGETQFAGPLYFVLFIFSVYVFWVVLRRNLPIDVGPAIAIIFSLSVLAFGVYSLLLNGAIALFQAAS